MTYNHNYRFDFMKKAYLRRLFIVVAVVPIFIMESVKQLFLQLVEVINEIKEVW